jgi:SSS family solute:Na+ symporter
VGVVTGLAVIDWAVLGATIAAIVGYGAWRTAGVRDADSYVRGEALRWPTIGLGIMATQASAITFLSLPGQAYADGMRFVQFYFGLPLATILISAVFVPVYHRLRVRTAYEYLEHRFDLRVRLLGALLFLIGRGLAAGITIYAPSIILSQILGWPLHTMIWGIGALVVLYVLLGGSRAVSVTQRQQMIVIMIGLVIAAVIVIARLPEPVSLGGAVRVAGALGRINPVSFQLDLDSRYNFWAGITGGFFLQLSYFGTDQSQVQRYLAGRSITESRLGLLFNGMFKVPMQFLILFIGVMVFVFFVFTRPPMHFDAPTLARVEAARPAEVHALEARFDDAFEAQRSAAIAYLAARGRPDEPAVRARLTASAAEIDRVRAGAKQLIQATLPDAQTRDTDFVFLTFILQHIPHGLVGLLLAVILCAAMSSVAGELVALGSTTAVDFYLRLRQALGRPPGSRTRDLRASQLAMVAWGAIVLGIASAASLFANLIEAVNILGSLFYGTILGLFVVALFLRRITATPVLLGAIAAELLVVALFFTSTLGYLWFNVIGCATVVVVSSLFQVILPARPSRSPAASSA